MGHDQIESHLLEKRTFAPSDSFSADALVGNEQTYETLYIESIEKPEEFWAKQAEEHLRWFKKWDTVLEHDFTQVGKQAGPYVQFFSGGKLNVSDNCLDRHLESRGEKAAIIWQGEDEREKKTLSYRELHGEVCKFASVLAKHGAKKGTTITIYMPMVPEMVIAMLACARLGAIHSVVFSAFSPDSLRNRILDCNSEFVVTSDVSYHAGKTSELKTKVDRAIESCPSVQKVLVFNRGNTSPCFTAGRDFWWHEEMEQADPDFPAAEMDSEDPLFILYTSGSTGKPKGVLHTSAGYLLYAHVTSKYVFDLKEDDVFWCTADCGWITGHSYLTYGPLSNGATCLMFEGVPTYPEPDRFWKLVEDYRVSVFYTAPTALRALMRLGDEWVNKHDLSSLRLLGTVGEPINPEAWIWYHEVVGGKRCPIVDTWWQTETGGIMLTTLPGAMSSKPGAAGKPFFGIAPEVLLDDGTPAASNEGGSLTVSKPWPGMIRGVYGDEKNELIHSVYFSKFAGRYFSGDGCRVDEDGYHWLLGRIDDVINVSAHRFATAEIESALVAHTGVAEAAVVGFPHETKGQGIYCYVTLKQGVEYSNELQDELVKQVRSEIGPIATPDRIHFTPSLPKTRSGKIMRRILRKIAAGDTTDIGDTSTLADPSVVEALVETRVR